MSARLASIVVTSERQAARLMVGVHGMVQKAESVGPTVVKRASRGRAGRPSLARCSDLVVRRSQFVFQHGQTSVARIGCEVFKQLYVARAQVETNEFGRVDLYGCSTSTSPPRTCS